MNPKEQIRSYSDVLVQKYGDIGSPEREEFTLEAYSFYTGQIIEHARKNAKLTQAQLAEKIGADKSYISRIENGQTEPKTSTFYKLLAVMGLKIEISPIV